MTGHVPAAVKAPFNAALTDSLYFTAALLVVYTIAAALFTTREPSAAPDVPPSTSSQSPATLGDLLRIPPRVRHRGQQQLGVPLAGVAQ